jgi:hypothetical protein
MFSVGDEVVCIDDKFPAAVRALYRRLPKEGETYTIRAVYLGRSKMVSKTPGESDGEVGVLLTEIRNDDMPVKLNKNGQEDGFAGWRFRKLHEAEDDEHAEAEAEKEEVVLI